MSVPSAQQFDAIRAGYHTDPVHSLSLRAEAYIEPMWFAIDQREIIGKSCRCPTHGESQELLDG